jgi:hypothetical protein
VTIGENQANHLSKAGKSNGLLSVSTCLPLCQIGFMVKLTGFALKVIFFNPSLAGKEENPEVNQFLLKIIRKIVHL